MIKKKKKLTHTISIGNRNLCMTQLIVINNIIADDRSMNGGMDGWMGDWMDG